MTTSPKSKLPFTQDEARWLFTFALLRAVLDNPFSDEKIDLSNEQTKFVTDFLGDMMVKYPDTVNAEFDAVDVFALATGIGA